jgi:hypothetical protein
MEVDGDEADSQDQVVKKLVRYALACEYQRMPIKRANITEKGLYYVNLKDSRLTHGSYVETTHPIQTSIRTCTEATQECLWDGDG